VETNPKALKAIMEQVGPQTAASPVTEAMLEEADRLNIIAACDYLMDTLRRQARRRANDKAGGRIVAGHVRGPYGDARTGVAADPACRADYDKILEIGYNGIIQEARERIEQIRAQVNGHGLGAEDADSIEWLEAVIIAVEGMIHHAQRYANLAREMAEREAGSSTQAGASGDCRGVRVGASELPADLP